MPTGTSTTKTTTSGMLRIRSTGSRRVRRGPVLLPPLSVRDESATFPTGMLTISTFNLQPKMMRIIDWRLERPITCASLALGSIVVGAIPRPLVLRVNPTLTLDPSLDPSPAMLSMVHDYDLVTGENHEGRKP